MRGLVWAVLCLAACPRTAPEPAATPRAVDVEPVEFSPDSVGVNWVVEVAGGGVSPDAGTQPGVEFLFYQGLLGAEDYAAGRFCRLVYHGLEVESVTEAELITAWMRWAVDTTAEPVTEGRCEESGTWGSTPAAWLAEQRVVVGLGPVSDATLVHLEGLWPHYQAQYGGPLSEVASDLIGGQLVLDGRSDADWGFGLARPVAGASVPTAEGLGRVSAAELQDGAPTPARVSILGMRPYKIGPAR